LQAVVAQVAVAVQAAMVVAAVLEVVVARVAVVETLEATQMATHSVDHAVAAATGTVALIAGASGLVGKELLARLLSDPSCVQVHSLVRKPSGLKHAKLREHVVDFANLTASSLDLPATNEVFICLGTTIKVAGSKEAFRAVDFDAVVGVAGIGIARGATKLGVISAMGASSSSGVFYSRVKGEMEEAIAKLGYASVSIARPSFLAGNREVLAQAARPGEKIALSMMAVFKPMIPANYRSVQASDVAASLLRQVRLGMSGSAVLLSGQLHA
jgi:uncharacterized protein YbjT (DUF2867 family)